MIVINNECKKILEHNNYVALGSFDGLHKGHISLVNKAVEIAEKNRGKSMVLTFKNHPRSLLDKNFIHSVIMSNDKKYEILKKYNVDILCYLEFNKEFMKLTPEKFIQMLILNYNIKGIVVGFNYKFGYKNEGDVDLLRQLQKIYGYELYVMKPYLYRDEVISSTRIRNDICDGNFVEVNNMLNRPYSLSGKVVHGKKIGRTIGFPTANLEFNDEFILPKMGVYYTKVKVNNKMYKGITNIGNNPTVNGDKMTIETYILDFSQYIYGLDIEVFFIKKIREVVKFNSLNALKEQIQRDKQFVIKVK